MSNLPKSTKLNQKKINPFVARLQYLFNLRILKFIGVGGFCAGLSVGLMYLSTSILGINYLISTVISIVITNFIGFALNKYYTFQTHKKLFWREMWKYYSVMLSSYILNIIFMYFLVNFINIWYIYANLVLIVLLTPYNYLLHRNWSFRKNKLNSLKQKLNENETNQ